MRATGRSYPEHLHIITGYSAQPINRQSSKITLRYSICILFFGLLACGCATTSSVKDAPLSEGVSKTYEANFDEVVKATRDAMTDAGLEIEEAYEADEEAFVIIGKTGASGFSWGEYARSVVVGRESGNTTVRVLTKKRLATNVTAEGDYSDEIFSSLDITFR